MHSVLWSVLWVGENMSSTKYDELITQFDIA